MVWQAWTRDSKWIDFSSTNVSYDADTVFLAYLHQPTNDESGVIDKVSIKDYGRALE